MKACRVAFAAGVSLVAATCVAMAQTPAPTPAPSASTSSSASPATAEPASSASASSAPAPTTGQAPTSLSVYFSSGSYTLTAKEQATLDEASRIFNDGKPIVMIITGMADATGAPAPNLLLSQKRADVVFQGLIARGLPPNHFQILAAGDSASVTGKEPPGADPAFRKVEITWR